MSNLGNTLMQEEKELVKEITADYSTTYAGFMITGNVSFVMQKENIASLNEKSWNVK